LAELAALRDENLISPEDYAAKREEITAAKPDQARLAELAALRDEDLISPKDYAAKRDQILGKAPPATELPPVTTAPAKPAVSVTPAAPAAPAAKEAPKAPPVQKAKPKPAATAPIPIPGAEKPKAETAEKPAVPAPAKTATPAPEATPAPAPTPTPAKAAPAPAKKETKVAALPKRLPSTGTPQLQLDFNNSTATLSPSQVEQVKQLAGRLKEGTDRVQVRAYAGATGEDTGSARRASLKRALAVRSRLIEGGIRSTRVDVRALGVADDGGPADRVDIFTAAR